MLSRRAADDLGELLDSAIVEIGVSDFGTAFCFLDCADGGVDGAIGFSPLVFGRSKPDRCSVSEAANVVDLTPIASGTSLKIEASEGLAEDEVCPIVLLL